MKCYLFLLLALLWGRILSFTPHATRSASLPFFRLVGSSSRVTVRRGGAVMATATGDVNVLDDLGLPNGLRETLLTNTQVFSKRIWIIDNSGSMAMLDGHQVLQGSTHTGCSSSTTRWAEAQETVNCHAQLNAALGAPTDFQLLNQNNNNGGGPQSFRVGYGRQAVKDSKRAQSILSRTKPKGTTPLAGCITKIRRDIVRMLPQLKSDGTKVAIVIATDGCNYDQSSNTPQNNNVRTEEEMNQDVLEALESLQGLPVCVVIRLCTDYGPLVDFYNGLDAQDSLSLDVLDDHLAEAMQVYQHNPWLNYALILHRMREMGQCSRLFDLLDERPLTKDEIRNFCMLLFGKNKGLADNDCNDDDDDWASFVDKIEWIQQKESMHLNPRTNAMSPWIDIEELALLE